MKRPILGALLFLWALVAGAQLTTQQASAIKAACTGDGQCNTFWNAGNDIGVRDRMNTTDATFYLWRSDASVQQIFESITWANLTPADVADGTQLWMNRALAAQGKQFNIQTMLTGRAVLDARKSTLRAGLQDALTNLPTGVNGASVSAGWVTVRDTALKRNATLAEKALSDTSGGNVGTNANPALPVFEGNITLDNVTQARNAP